MTKRIRLTAFEIEAVLAAAGDVDYGATFENLDGQDSKTQEQWEDAYNRGMEKLRHMLAQRK